jgi:prevent-host-death family protein
MKTVTLSQARTNLDELLRAVAAGEEVEILEKRRPIARLIPPPSEPADWSGSFARLDSIWGKTPLPGPPASRIVIEGRR